MFNRPRDAPSFEFDLLFQSIAPLLLCTPLYSCLEHFCDELKVLQFWFDVQELRSNTTQHTSLNTPSWVGSLNTVFGPVSAI